MKTAQSGNRSSVKQKEKTVLESKEESIEKLKYN